MSHVLNLLSDLKITKSSKFLFEEGNTEFPQNPVKGEFAFVSGILYMYTSIRNIETWYPLTNSKKSYIHVQDTVSSSWVVNHNLGSTIFIFMVYDSDGDLVLANLSNVLENSFVLNFSTQISGKAVVFADAINTSLLNSNQQYISIGSTNGPRLYSGGDGVLELKNNNDILQSFLLYGRFISDTSYQRSGWKSTKQELTLSGSSVSTTTLIIPRYSYLIGVTTRVTSDIGISNGVTGYKVGNSIDSDLWGNITSTTVGTTSDARDYTALNALGTSTVDRAVTITAIGGNFDGSGVIEICAFYLRAEAD